jgi:hypothetical protein
MQSALLQYDRICSSKDRFGNEDPRSYFRHSFQFLPPASVEHSVDEGPIGSSMINVLLTG